MLFVNNLSAPLTFPFSIKCLNFMETFCKFIGVLVDGSISCISLLSSSNWLILPSSHNFNRLSNVFRCMKETIIEHFWYLQTKLHVSLAS